MKVASILGAPRKNGNTAKMLAWMEEELVKAGHEIDRINLFEKDLNGCMGCGTCRKEDEFKGCCQNDDGNEVIGRMNDADAIIFSSPLYCWSYTAAMQALVERCYCTVRGYGQSEHKSTLGGKNAAFLLTGAGPEKGNAEMALGVLDKVVNFIKVKDRGRIYRAFCTTPEELGEEDEKNARDLARALAE